MANDDEHRRFDGSWAPAFEPRGQPDWEALAAAELGEAGLDVLRTRLTPRLAANALYFDASPALAPQLRARTRRWMICQEYSDPRMDRSQAQISADLAHGVEALWVVGGLDHGVRVLTAGDLREVLERVDLRKTPVFYEPEADVLGVAVCHVAYAESRGVDVLALQGCFGADPLGTLARAGTLGGGIRGARRELVALGRWSREHTPAMRAVLVSSRAYHDAGAGPAQELAWTIATLVEYLRWMVDAGLSVEDAARQITLGVCVGGELVPEVAKLRALRLLAAKVLHAAGATSLRPWIHARTSFRTRTRRDPWVNMLRATAETFAAAVGGADSIASTPFDEAIGPSDDHARRVARNTQLVLREESYLGHVDDPAGGSWLFESVTNAIADEAWSAFQEIEAAGGMTRALAQGKIAGSLDATRKELDRRSADRTRPILGVSEYPNLGEQRVRRAPVELADVEVELGNPFSQATADERHDALLELAHCARSEVPPETLVQRALEAARTGVDVLSLASVLRAGKASLHLEPLRPYRASELWESLRDRADVMEKRTGYRPTAAIVTVGPASEHAPRLTWTRTVLAAGGIDAQTISGDDHDAAAAALAEGAHPLAVLCAADARYDAAVPVLVPALKAKGARLVLVAGRPSVEQEAEFAQRGVDGFFFLGSDIRSLLTRVYAVFGGAA